MIIPESELLAVSNGLTLVRAVLKITQNYVVLDLGPEGFLDFCKCYGIEAVFYQYTYYDKESYIITEDILHQYTDNKREYSYCKKWADKRNIETESFDFNRAKALALAATMGSMTLIMTENDHWIDEAFEPAEDALIRFQEDHEDELIELADPVDSGTDLIDEFREKLLDDERFRYCTNKESRRSYAEEFFRRKENKHYYNTETTNFTLIESRLN